MTEQKQATWAAFGGAVNVDESTFDEKVGGTSFLDVGTHKDVTIVSVEPKVSQAGNFYVKVRYENDDEAGINDNIILTGTDKEGNTQFHWIYRRLSAALCDDAAMRLKFFGEVLPNKPELFNALVGMRLTVKIKLGSEGYLIKDVSTGGKMLVDVETDEQFEGTEIYEDFTEAKDAADELGLRRCYCEIDKLVKPSEEYRDSNRAVIEGLLTENDKPAEKIKPKKKAVQSI